MVRGVHVATDIAQPDISAAISQQVGQTLVDQVVQPVGGGGFQAVLEDHNRPFHTCTTHQVRLQGICAL